MQARIWLAPVAMAATLTVFGARAQEADLAGQVEALGKQVEALSARLAGATDRPGNADDIGFDFNGYIRAGIGGTQDGGDQVCVKLPGAGAKYRLGNECELYSELALGATLWRDNDSDAYFRLQNRLAFSLEAENDWEVQSPAYREAYVEAGNVFGGVLEGARFWVGKRFYGREDIHINDFYYWDGSGPGGGVENVDLGFGKLAAAFFRNVSNDNQPDEVAVSRTDIRVSDIAMPGGGSLTIGGDVRFTDQFGNEAEEQSGVMLTVQHFQGGLLGGFNKFALQAGYGLASSLGSWSKFGVSDNDATYRVVEQLTFQPNDNWSGQLAALWEIQETQDWISFGIRPKYNFTDNFAVALELGNDFVKPDNGDWRRLTKVTLAPQITAGRGFWARPALRAFVTYADWNDAAAAAGTIGLGDDEDELTFGLQFEAWW